MLHTVERFVIHFFSSAGVLLCALFALRFAARKIKTAFLPDTYARQLLFCAVAVFCGAALREAIDVHYGQSLTKAIFDYISWAAGCGCSIWALVRLRRLE
jgi:hypothetical protein